MTNKPVSILAYVEDPGAANMVLGLRQALTEKDAKLTLLAGGAALDYLSQKGETAEMVSGAVEAAIDTHHPDAVVVGTAEDPATPAHDLVDIARRAGIPTLGLVDGPANTAHRFRGHGDDPLTHRPDKLLVADSLTADAFRALGVSRKDIEVCGNPSFDLVRHAHETLSKQDRRQLRREQFPGVGDDQPVLLFLAELSDGLDPSDFKRSADYSLDGRGDTDGRTEIVLEEILDAVGTLTPHPHMVLRLHPKTPKTLYEAYSAEIDGWSSGGTPYPALAAADLVVGLSTVLLFEAALMGCNVLSVLPREQEAAWLTSNALGITPYVTTQAGVREALQKAFSDPEGFMPKTPEDMVPADASQRIASAVLKTTTAGHPIPVLETPRLRLEPFPTKLLTERYVNWLNDPEVVRFSEQRHRHHTLESCRDFVESFDGTRNALWALREKDTDLRHIGNISTEVDLGTGTGDIRILLGEKDAWGTGLGLEAWRAVMRYLFDDLGLEKVTAGTLEANIGMRRIMEKSGLRETHRRPGPTLVDGKTMDMVYGECHRTDFRADFKAE